MGVEMVVKGITEGYESGWHSRTHWPGNEPYPPVAPHRQIRPTGERNPDVITLYEEEGIWASRKIQTKEVKQEKAPSYQRSPFRYSGSGRAYSFGDSKGEIIDLFA
jgi:hypothetical protein